MNRAKKKSTCEFKKKIFMMILIMMLFSSAVAHGRNLLKIPKSNKNKLAKFAKDEDKSAKDEDHFAKDEDQLAKAVEGLPKEAHEELKKIEKEMQNLQQIRNRGFLKKCFCKIFSCLQPNSNTYVGKIGKKLDAYAKFTKDKKKMKIKEQEKIKDFLKNNFFADFPEIPATKLKDYLQNLDDSKFKNKDESKYGTIYVIPDTNILIKRIEIDPKAPEESESKIKEETMIAMMCYIHDNELFVRTYGYFLIEKKSQGKSYAYIIMDKFGGSISSYDDKDPETMKKEIQNLFMFVKKVDEVLDKLYLTHFDVKPQNILYDGSNFKLIDFGMTRLMESERSSAPQLKGSKNYWPPSMYANWSFDDKNSSCNTAANQNARNTNLVSREETKCNVIQDQFAFGLILLQYANRDLWSRWDKCNETDYVEKNLNEKRARKTKSQEPEGQVEERARKYKKCIKNLNELSKLWLVREEPNANITEFIENNVISQLEVYTNPSEKN